MKIFYFYAVFMALTIFVFDLMAIKQEVQQQYFTNVISLLILSELCLINSKIKNK